MISRIDDVNDPRLSPFADMRTRRIDPAWSGDDAAVSYDVDDTFVVEGRWCVQQLARSSHAVVGMVVQDGREHEAASWVGADVPVYVLSAAAIRKLVGFDFHRGVIACGRRPTFLSVAELVAFRSANVARSEHIFAERKATILCVLGVSQQDNLGSMIRTAMALGVDRLIVGPKTADPYSRRAIRVSMAAVFGMTVYQLNDPAVELASLAGVRTVVTTLDSGATPLDEFVIDDRPMVLVVGSEPDGVDAGVQVAATDRVTIPMRGGIDSMNVAVAAGVFLYALTRS